MAPVTVPDAGLITRGAVAAREPKYCPRCHAVLDVNVCRAPGCGYGWDYQAQPLPPQPADPATRARLEPARAGGAAAVERYTATITDSLTGLQKAIYDYLISLADLSRLEERLSGRPARSTFDERRAAVRDRVLPSWPDIERALVTGQLHDEAGNWRAVL